MAWDFSDVRRGALLCSAGLTALLSPTDLVRAQGATAEGNAASPSMSPGAEDIIVTARKRDETSLSVPVVITAIGQAELNRRAIINLDGISRIVPSLIVGDSGGSAQGGIVALRGITAGEANPFSDTAVAFNIDGVQIARSAPRRLSQMDMAQVEVLKGPQALYFGKNSPGGIIVIRTADPTSTFSARVSGEYEAYAKEWRAEGYVSGPLTDTLALRVAAYASDMKGWVTNEAPQTPLNGPRNRTVPIDEELGVRLTLKFEPSDQFDARFKFAYGTVTKAGFDESVQQINCPFGTPQLGPGDLCRADDRVRRPDPGPAFSNLSSRFGDGVPFYRQKQYLSGLEANYRPSDVLTVSSITSFYKNYGRNNANTSTFPAPTPTFLPRLIGSASSLHIREIAQELRLTSSLDGPLNFMVGGFYQRANMRYVSLVGVNALSPSFLIPPFDVALRGQAWSVFGNLSFKPLESIELSGGGRYSREKKRFRALSFLTGNPFNPLFADGTQKSRGKWNNFSPEATFTWRPTSRFTAFTAFKRGFLSGGFNAGSGNPGLDRSYDQTIVEGFEGGLKGLFLDNSLRANLALFSYKVKGQQVSSLVGVSQNITNAGSSRTKGVEFDANWQTPLKGFSVRGGVAYNDARYLVYQGAPCYTGQTPTLGCTVTFAPVQDLSGQRLLRAPKWGTSLGASYEIDDGRGNKFLLAADANHSSAYFTEATNNPNTKQEGFWLVDVTASVKMASGIEAALIGRNITNTYYVQRSVDEIFTGSGTGTAAGVLADTLGGVSRGREIRLRLSVQLAGDK